MNRRIRSARAKPGISRQGATVLPKRAKLKAELSAELKAELSAKLKTKLRAATKLEDGRLEALLADLNCAVAVYRDHTSDTRWHEDWAQTLERLVELAASAPDGVLQYALELWGVDRRQLPQLPQLPQLRYCAERARGAAQDRRAPKNPKHRPAWVSGCRNYLARKAKEILERHSPKLPAADLRRAVAAVLDFAGARYPEPKNEGAKFDAMFSETSQLSAEEHEARAEELSERLRDVPI